MNFIYLVMAPFFSDMGWNSFSAADNCYSLDADDNTWG